MKLFKMNKTVLRLQNNIDMFLKGLTANTLAEPRNSFVNIHGKVIAVFDQSRTDDESFYICLEQDFIDRVMTHLDRYIKLSGVQVEQMKGDVYFDCDDSCDFQSGDLIFPQKKGRMIFTSRSLQATIKDEDFQLFRLENNIPLQGVDFDEDFLLNIGMDEFVSFDKGCFLGQEPISKVYNRAKPSWKLVVKSKVDCSEEEFAKMTSKTLDPETQMEQGFVFVRNS